jgi:hypothetical protein
MYFRIVGFTAPPSRKRAALRFVTGQEVERKLLSRPSRRNRNG